MQNIPLVSHKVFKSLRLYETGYILILVITQLLATSSFAPPLLTPPAPRTTPETFPYLKQKMMKNEFEVN